MPNRDTTTHTDAATPSLWRGVLPAITTPFTADRQVDLDFLDHHARWLVDHGCRGIVALGSLGEGATLEENEKVDILARLVAAVRQSAPVIAAISALSTAAAVRLARQAEAVGCRGLMVLPPYVHKGEWREIRAHFDAVLEATSLPAMLYNNPMAYGTDLLPEQLAELAARHGNVEAVKESSGDSRRVTALSALLGERLELLVGLDDMALEGVAAGATGWVAGLVNALPTESVELFELALEGRWNEARELYRWFLPLLRLDTVPDFVQRIKLVQREVGIGSERVRLPRLPLAEDERQRVIHLVRDHLARRPAPVLAGKAELVSVG